MSKPRQKKLHVRKAQNRSQQCTVKTKRHTSEEQQKTLDINRKQALVAVPADLRVAENLHSDVTQSHSGMVAKVQRVLDPVICRHIIDVAERSASWVSQKDTVDGKPEWQHTVFDGAMFHDVVLVPLVEHLSKSVLLPVLSSKLGLQTHDLKLSWAFVRAYSPDRRQSFPIHRDRSLATANLLLTPQTGQFCRIRSVCCRLSLQVPHWNLI